MAEEKNEGSAGKGEHGVPGAGALCESEARFRAIFNRVSDIILLLEITPGGIPVIIDLNESVCRILGYSREELVGKPVSILDPGLTPEVARERQRKAEVEGRFTVMHPCKDGTVREFESSASALTLGDKRLAISVERDVTERRKTEDELGFRAALLDNSSDAIQALETDGKIIYANKTTFSTTGYVREELLGRPITVLDSPEDAALAKVRIAQLFKEGSAQFAMRRVRKDGTSFPVEVYASMMEMEGRKIIIAVDRDITERARAEADIRESYEIQGVLNSILRHSLEPIPLEKKLEDHLASLSTLPWLAVEPRGAVFLAAGRTLKLAVQRGLAPALLSACASVPFGKCLCGRAAESGEPVAAAHLGPEHEITYEGMAPHGHYCAPIKAAGKILGVLNLYLKESTEISGKRRDFIAAVCDILAADILHARMEEQFVHAQKMEAVGHMAGGVAHDFNNILTAITGYAEFLRAALPPGDPKSADVEEIIKAGDRASALTRQLLVFCRKQVVHFRPLDLDQLVPDVMKMIRRMIPEDIEFRTFLGSAPAQVMANQGQIEQMLINLAVNARDAMPDGGKLTFETARVELDSDYAAAHHGVSPGRYVMLAVTDTGCGMSPEVAERVFEPFFTTKERGRGTGLGLSTVYGIVKQGGGEIFVYSEPGKGTAFKVYLPVAGQIAAEAPQERLPLAACQGAETVLVVEDDESVRRFVTRCLSQNGYSVLEAAAPREALRICETRRDISLMITDIIMPQMNGYELSRAVQASLPRLKVIFMSGYTDNALSRPVAAFLEKPLKADVLLRTVREVLDSGRFSA